jgi:dimethylaniline monooxygenase (N-oxide forming)
LQLPRVMNGIPFDHTMTARKLGLAGWLELNAHSVFEFMFNKGLLKMQNSTFKIQPEWRLSPAPSIKHAVPIVSDNLIDTFAAGEVTSIHGIRKAIGSNEIELTDGTVVGADTIIYCTGYKTDFAIVDSSVDPTRNTTPEWAATVGSKGKPLPRLYKGIISLDHPQSLAFMGNVAFATGAFPLYDLASMALAQIWKGNTALPSSAEMNQSVDAHHAWMCRVAREGPVPPGWVRQADWLAWANDAAGTGINEKLGWGAEGWRFWMSDRAWCGTLMDGILSPHVYRLFEGKRKRWDGARQEIEKVNQRAAERKQMLATDAKKD